MQQLGRTEEADEEFEMAKQTKLEAKARKSRGEL